MGCVPRVLLLHLQGFISFLFNEYLSLQKKQKKKVIHLVSDDHLYYRPNAILISFFILNGNVIPNL